MLRQKSTTKWRSLTYSLTKKIKLFLFYLQFTTITFNRMGFSFYRRRWKDIFKINLSCSLLANLASTHTISQLTSFQGLGHWGSKLAVTFYGSQPKTQCIGKVMTCTTSSITFNKWTSSE